MSACDVEAPRVAQVRLPGHHRHARGEARQRRVVRSDLIDDAHDVEGDVALVCPERVETIRERVLDSERDDADGHAALTWSDKH